MSLATRISSENIDRGGGPFGAVVVKDIIATGANSVTLDNDPTAHDEVQAIRSACHHLGTFKLTGCTVYSSCQRCPMCLSALYWAGVKRIYYGNTKEDADAIDFSDDFIYRQLDKSPDCRYIPEVHVEDTDAIEAFRKWASSTHYKQIRSPQTGRCCGRL